MESKEEAPQGFGEEEAGICQYVSTENIKIPCSIKHRFSDFIVNEIDENDNVIWFKPETDLQFWKKPMDDSANGATQEQEEVKDSKPQPDQQATQFSVPEDSLNELKQLLSEEDFKMFTDYLENLNDGSIEKSTIICFKGPFEDKALRSRVHQFFKEKAAIFETDTKVEGELRIVRLFLKAGLSQNKRRKFGVVERKSEAQKNLPQYLQFVIQKSNVDSMQAVHYIAKKLKKVGKNFQICGNKDKRGITTQRATVIRGNPELLIRFQRAKDWDNKIKLGTFERVHKPLRLGQLNGNRFSVALRFIPIDLGDKEIGRNVQNLERNGFINYFGMQRFGTYNVRTHQIGIQILNQNWQKVVELILSQHPDGDLAAKESKKQLLDLVFEQKNLNAAFAKLDKRDRLEKALLAVLRKSPNSYYNAFQNITRNTRLIYVHAYQSFIWNKSVSERFKRYGTQVLIGDLVVPKEAKDLDIGGELGEEAQIEEVPEEGDEIDEEKKKDKESNGYQSLQEMSDRLVEVTKENIDQYGIDDVVMPVIGYKTKMPKNQELQEIIFGIMKEDYISMQNFEQQASFDATSSWGSYRKIIGRVKDLEYDIVEFQNGNEDLLTAKYKEEKDPKPEIDREDKEKPIYKALRIKFSLKQSSYATMVLREITKVSSAFSVQSLISQKYNQ